MKKGVVRGRGRGRGRGHGTTAPAEMTRADIPTSSQSGVVVPTPAASHRSAVLLPFVESGRRVSLLSPKAQEKVVQYLVSQGSSTISSSSTPTSSSGPQVASSKPPSGQSKITSWTRPELLASSQELFDHSVPPGFMGLSSPPSTGEQQEECSDAQLFLLSEDEGVFGDRRSTAGSPKSVLPGSDDDETQVPEPAAFPTLCDSPHTVGEDEEVDDEVLDPTWRQARGAAGSSSEAEAEEVFVEVAKKAKRSGGPVTVLRHTPVNRNAAWNFFKAAGADMTKATCQLCKQIISRGKDPKHLSSSAMVRHLEKKHPIVWEAHKKSVSLRGDTPVPASPSALPSATPPSPPAAGTTAPPPQARGRDFVLPPSLPPGPRSSQSSSIATLDHSTATLQPTLPDLYARKQKYRPSHERARMLTGRIAKLLAVEMLPFRLAGTDAFRHLMAGAVPQYVVPSRHFFARTAIPALRQHVDQRIKNALRQSVSGQVHLTTDTWTSRHGQGRYISLTAHWVNIVAAGPEGGGSPSVLPTPRRLTRSPISLSSSSTVTSPSTSSIGSVPELHRSGRGQRQQAVLKLICLGEQSHTATALQIALKQQTDAWLLPLQLHPGKVVCDNGRNLVAALHLANLTHVPCLAHVFNLVVQSFLRNYPQLPALLAKVRKVCSRARRSSTVAIQLAQLQRKHRLPAHRLICDLPTRWNSTLQMVARVCEQKAAIVDFQLVVAPRDRASGAEEQLTAVEWAKLHDLCLVLRCMEDCTKLVSAEDAIISMTIPLLCLLRDTLVAMREEVTACEVEEEEEMMEEPNSWGEDVREGGLGASWQSGSQPPMSTRASQVVSEEEDEEEHEECLVSSQFPSTTMGTVSEAGGIVRGWGDAEEPEFTPPAEDGEWTPGSLQHMCACMSQCVLNDPRVMYILGQDDYWVATLLDPRYKDKMPSLLTSGLRDTQLSWYQRRLLTDLISEFPQGMSGSSTFLATSGQRQESICGPRPARSSTGSAKGRMAQAWKTFMCTGPVPATSDRGSVDRDLYLSSQVQEYIATGIDVLHHPSFPYDFWLSKMERWPELAQYAMKVLSCPAASVLSERVFSTAGGVITDRRTRLSTDNVDILTFIKMNESWISPNYISPVGDTTPL